LNVGMMMLTNSLLFAIVANGLQVKMVWGKQATRKRKPQAERVLPVDTSR